ncbi:MAG TPA: VWA domain-containing protein [Pyrinomonadaceae bacterium]|jgi:VWFA-related protein
MLKSLANSQRASKPGNRLLLLLFAAFLALLCGGCLIAASAQQQKQQDGKQRPRRVGAQQQQQRKPTPQASPPSATEPEIEEVDAGDVVRVDTQLVSIPAVVYDHTGRLMISLRAENFNVYEDGRPQRISNFATTEAPFEVALLLDTSGSTRADVALIRRAANAFIDALRPGDRVAVIAFDSKQDGDSKHPTVDIASHLTSDRKALRESLERIGTSNGTPFYDALERIADDVFNEQPREEVRGRRAVVALTDGVDSTSIAEYADARDKLLRAGLACFFIQVNTEDFVEDRLMKDCQDDGALTLSRTQLQRYRRIFVPRADASDYESFCRMGPFERMQISRDLYNLARREMNDLARASGGRNFVAADLRDARAAFAQVAAEIGTQYSLGYYPTNKTRDGRFRAIKVEVKGVAGGAQVRAREGYYAPKG